MRTLVAVLLLVSAAAGRAAGPATPYLEQMTWTELRERIDAGATTALLPIGATEQSGPHIALGKHNVRVHAIAGRIAERLGNAVVAPVLAYVPEGSIEPPAAHMRFAGTISITDAAFESVLEGAARSLCAHGLRDIVFLGDHGGYQAAEQRAADRLNKAWSARSRCRAHALPEYYRVTQTDFVAALKSKGLSADEIGSHAGAADTALTLAIDPTLVRSGALARAAQAGAREGVSGDPRRASAELGRLGVERIVEASATRIRELTRAPR